MTRVRRSWLLLFLWGALISGEPSLSEARSPTVDPTLHSRAMERATRLPRLRSLLKPCTWSRWSGREYGYGWWIGELAGHQAYYGYGHGGQFIFVVPDLRLTAATTSSTTPRQERWERRMHRWAIYDLFEQDLIPAIGVAVF